jgi:pimeloyl-ACP methyl ester carboxylesterase
MQQVTPPGHSLPLFFVEHRPVAARAGRGRDAVLLHGFPEFSYGWRHQMPALAAAGFRAIAPDLRGYGRSPKPPRVIDYRVELLAADVVELIRRECGGRAHLVGHDWGGVIAWYLAMHHPDVVDRLVVLNAPHPAAYFRELRRPAQILRSWYALFFQLPWLPEFAMRWNEFKVLRRVYTGDAGFSGAEADVYVEAFTDRRSLTGAINYYRAAFRDGQALRRRVRRIEAPTLLIWGMRDRYLVPALTDYLAPWVTDLRVERLPHATHWVQHDEPERVNGLMIDFLRG